MCLFHRQEYRLQPVIDTLTIATGYCNCTAVVSAAPMVQAVKPQCNSAVVSFRVHLAVIGTLAVTAIACNSTSASEGYWANSRSEGYWANSRFVAVVT